MRTAVGLAVVSEPFPSRDYGISGELFPHLQPTGATADPLGRVAQTGERGPGEGERVRRPRQRWRNRVAEVAFRGTGVASDCGGRGVMKRPSLPTARMYPSSLSEEPNFNVSFTRHPAATSGGQQPGSQHYGDPGGVMMSPLTPTYQVPPNAAHMMSHYPPPPSYCNHPPPPYEQVLQDSEKK
ncbi:hypothetical protein JZ751_000826 [Albula glossodonta]|uniref:WW domain binding protein VOPP1 n=1 Tax=Albula glossodonta TaxID=121402 RepID=A0A8T2PWT9_9TELE|nr:hypothetical protein JZ751_000826 [Albula glossodonta]